jgi:glycosyltransferase involved in cell wall biosynthesis
MEYDDTRPLVSCIMPTYNRREFVPFAIKYFQRQDYDNKELIIVDDGSDAIGDLIPDEPGIRYIRLERKITLGAKLNMACSQARGTIMVNWDDDDWYADWRLTYQVSSLQKDGAGVCGINKLFYYDLRNKKAFRYTYPPDQRTWLLGSSLCYTKQLWISNRFAEIDVGMDGLFVWNTSPGRVTVLDNYNFSVHMIHNRNVSPKQTDGIWWHTCPEEEIQDIMGADWRVYSVDDLSHSAKVNGSESGKKNGVIQPISAKNIYACLVHESQDCIRDLVQNLHYNDPSSRIILYNGSNNPALIPDDFSLKDFGAIVHPRPSPARHGYLHTFAVDCMQFALENFDFDCLTIVDSDQLSIRAGYSEYIGKAIAAAPANTGMFSSKPERVDRNNRTNHVALQAFREYDLWKPFLNQFEKGEEKFVHWTFWPSTVFMANAVKDIARLFKVNKQLQEIIQRTKIWATEEVILPTLVSLLGYEIINNPCSYDFVRYKLSVNKDEIGVAMKRNDAYWLHPVARNIDDPVRKLVREQFCEYNDEDNKPVFSKHPPANPATPKKSNEAEIIPLLNKINKIEGWLSAAEAQLLITATKEACYSLAPPHTIVEVGSYQGKATVLMGMIIKENFPAARIISIDPHDGKLGAADQGLKIFPPSLDMFKKNLDKAGISDVVDVVQGNCQDIEWHLPLSLLVIDGLHDYMNVSRDFNHFSDLIRPGGYVAFHDYADYYPGVKVFVNELLAKGVYRKTQFVDSMIIVQKA